MTSNINESTEGVQETIKEKCLREFIDWRHNYIDEIPKERVAQDDPDLKRYKCRAHFFLGILNRTHVLMDAQLLKDVESTARYEAFKNFVAKLDREKFQPDKPTTKEDIEEANKFLDYLIDKLQKEI